MKFVHMLSIAILVAFGGWWIWENASNARELVEPYIENGDIATFETRYTPESIMEQWEKELLGSDERSFQKVELKFHPYVLFEVKYSGADKKTKEGVLLWDLVDGEMLIDCKRWEKTHGFEDAINAAANQNDFKILNALERGKGRLRIEQLSRELEVEESLLYDWIEEAKEKHLIVQRGNEIQLHFQDPKILVLPQTTIRECLVSKPYHHAQKIARRYSTREIEKIAHIAFGSDFAIRTKKEVFLPVYRIEIANPDDSVLTTYWNALNGKRMKGSRDGKL